jgi:hypothetical protein
MSISQVVAETGDRLIGLAPMLGLTCKSFYKFRVLKSLGAAPVCLKHVTRPADDWSRVTISNVAVHVPALAESADRLSAIRWEIDFLELRAFLDERPQWPKALKDVEVRPASLFLWRRLLGSCLLGSRLLGRSLFRGLLFSPASPKMLTCLFSYARVRIFHLLLFESLSALPLFLGVFSLWRHCVTNP